MRFLDDRRPDTDLTYNDVFLAPTHSKVASRMEVDLTPPDGTGLTLPLVVANMTAVAGRRMAETVARRGGIAVMPQDIPVDILESNVRYVKSRHPIYETPITLQPTQTVQEAVNLIHKRAHGVVVVVDGEDKPVGIFTEHDGAGVDRYTQLSRVMSTELLSFEASLPLETMFERMSQARVHCAPVLEGQRLVGVITRKGALRSTLYKPALDAQGRLKVAAALGITGDVKGRAEAMLAAGVDLLVIDVAHGHQQRMLDAVEVIRKLSPK